MACTWRSGYAGGAPASGFAISTSTDGVHFRQVSGTDALYPAGDVRDPCIIFYRETYLAVFSHARSLGREVMVISSTNLVDWSPVCITVNSTASGDNYVDVPCWILDGRGGIHIMAFVDESRQWAEVHPLTAGSLSGAWSSPVTITDHTGGSVSLTANGSFILASGTYYLLGDSDGGSPVPVIRHSTSLTSGYSDAVHPRLEKVPPRFDSLSTIVLPGGTWRWHISTGDNLGYKITAYDSTDGGATWSGPAEVGFGKRRPSTGCSSVSSGKKSKTSSAQDSNLQPGD